MLKVFIEYLDIKGDFFSFEMLPKDYFEAGEIEIDAVPNYLRMEDYVDEKVENIDYVKVTIENKALAKKRSFSKRFLKDKKGVIFYNECSDGADVRQELISEILINYDPKTLLHTRVQISNGIPTVENKELVRFNADGMEEYTKL